MLSPRTPNTVPRCPTVTPGDVIAFHTSDGGGVCLIGVVATTPTTVNAVDGTRDVLVQPRPLLRVAPQVLEPQSTKTKKTQRVVRIAGQTVDRTDSAAVHLAVASIPAPPAEDHGAAVTDEEVTEMVEQRRTLQADLDTSKARINEIDALLRRGVAQQQQQSKKNSPRPQSATPAAEDAVRAVDVAERELLLARAGLRTVKAVSWSDLQRRTRRTASPALVRLVESAATLLHDPRCATFDDVVAQSHTLAKRLATVKAPDVSEDDRVVLQSVLQAWPTAASVEKEHRTAAALHRWLAALAKAAVAQRGLRAARDGGRATPRRSEGGAAAAAAVPPLSARSSTAFTAEAALRSERADQLDYVEMAEEEIAALDALIAEAQALAAHAVPPDDAASTATIAPALSVPAAWVVCVFAASDVPDMAACAAKPRGTPVAFALPENHKLVASVRRSAAAGVAGAKTEESSVKRIVSARSSGMVADDGKERRGSLGSTPPPTAISSRRVSGISTTSPRPSFANAAGAGAGAAAVLRVPEVVDSAPLTSAGPPAREAELEEKVRLLEARLSSALQQNPKEAELQLLRDEVTAKRGELQRVSDERDRLLLERRERSVWGAYGGAAAGAGRRRGSEVGGGGDGGAQQGGGQSSSSSPQRQLGSGRYARQLSSPRDVVDRSIVEDLEEQLTAAHQRISALQIEASQTRRRPSVTRVAAPSSANADPLLLSPTSFSAHGDVSDSAAANDGVRLRSPSAPPLSSSPLPAAAHVVPQEVYDEVESQLQSVTAALEAQRQSAQRLEEQLNSALHRRAEAEGVVAAQQRELEEVWEKLEAAEARAEEHSLLTQQRLLLAQSQHNLASPQSQHQQQQQQQQQQQVYPAPSSVSTAGTSYQSPQQASALAPSGLPRAPAQAAATPSEPFSGFVIPAAVHADLDSKSQANDDATTVITATGGGGAGGQGGNVSRLSFDGPPRGLSAADAFPSFGTTPQGATDPLIVAGLYGRSTSAAALQSRPVEQLSTIELRHEVHRLREDVARHQSGELRLSMELQTIKEKQKAEHRRRRDARVARMQMLSRMQDNIVDAMDKSNRDLEAIPVLLERGRAEAEALMLKRRMQR